MQTDLHTGAGTATTLIVIGVGNRFRRDDGAGPALVDMLRMSAPDVRAVESDGEPTGLIALWHGARSAVVVDAVRRGAEPGCVHRLCEREVVSGPGHAGGGSSHGLGIADAIALGRVMGRMPGRLFVFGIEPGDLGMGAGLTAPVAAAVEQVAHEIAGMARFAEVADLRPGALEER